MKNGYTTTGGLNTEIRFTEKGVYSKFQNVVKECMKSVKMCANRFNKGDTKWI